MLNLTDKKSNHRNGVLLYVGALVQIKKKTQGQLLKEENQKTKMTRTGLEKRR